MMSQELSIDEPSSLIRNNHHIDNISHIPKQVTLESDESNNPDDDPGTIPMNIDQLIPIPANNDFDNVQTYDDSEAHLIANLSPSFYNVSFGKSNGSDLEKSDEQVPSLTPGNKKKSKPKAQGKKKGGHKKKKQIAKKGVQASYIRTSRSSEQYLDLPEGPKLDKVEKKRQELLGQIRDVLWKQSKYDKDVGIGVQAFNKEIGVKGFLKFGPKVEKSLQQTGANCITRFMILNEDMHFKIGDGEGFTTCKNGCVMIPQNTLYSIKNLGYDEGFIFFKVSER